MDNAAQAARHKRQPGDMEGEIAASAYYSDHDLREMFSRDNAERRRRSGKMLRKMLTAQQDKKIMAQMVKIRDQYDVTNSDEVILAWVKQQIAAGKIDDIDAELVKAAVQADIPERAEPWDDDKGH